MRDRTAMDDSFPPLPASPEATPQAAAAPIRRIRLVLEYDGTDFHGWQIQSATGERTVQGTVERAVAALPGTVPRVMAAGRTDAGVHALAMTAHYDTRDRIPAEKIPRAINARLPADVRVLRAEVVPADFESQFGCRYRRYEYRLRLTRSDPTGSALDRNRVLHLPQALDVDAMTAAAPHFEGTRDYAALATQETRGTTRTVHLCRLEQSARDLTLHIAADGFLRNMVRAVVGTLLWIGERRLTPRDVDAILASRTRGRAGPNAPAHGLYFAEAGYEPWPAAPHHRRS